MNDNEFWCRVFVAAISRVPLTTSGFRPDGWEDKFISECAAMADKALLKKEAVRPSYRGNAIDGHQGGISEGAD
jgi:hypothetical protein